MYNPPFDPVDAPEETTEGAGSGVSTVTRVTHDHAVSRTPEATGSGVGACSVSESDMIRIANDIRYVRREFAGLVGLLLLDVAGNCTLSREELSGLIADHICNLAMIGEALGLLTIGTYDKAPFEEA